MSVTLRVEMYRSWVHQAVGFARAYRYGSVEKATVAMKVAASLGWKADMVYRPAVLKNGDAKDYFVVIVRVDSYPSQWQMQSFINGVAASRV